jgi:hypothetical protein
MKNGNLAVHGSLRTLLLISLFFALPSAMFAQQFYVSPAGTSSGNGSQASPWDLQTALNQPSTVTPGSTIYLLGGTYKGNYTSLLTGTAAKPIIVKNQQGQRVIVDGNLGASQNSSALLIKGAYTWFQGFEIMNSSPNRILSTTGSDPLGSRGDGLTVYGVGIKIINMIIHDNANGIGAWSVAADNEYYGNLIYNNGWIATDRNHGHGIYTQNNTGTKSFGNNIILNNLSYGVQAYGSATAPLNNFNFDGNALFNDRWLLGGSAPANNITVNNNFTYADTIEFGYAPVANSGLTLTNNIFSSTVEIRYWTNVNVTNNTIYDGPRYSASVFLLFNAIPNYSTFQFNNNTYYWSNPAPAGVAKEPQVAWSNATAADTDPNKSGAYLLSQWKQMGKDAQSTIQYFPQQSSTQMALSGIRTFLRKNKFDSTRSNLMVYNYSKATTIQANVDGFLFPGDSYELHNASDYFGDVIKGTYAGGTLSVPMTGHTMVNPIGLQNPMASNTFPEFGTFILIKTPGNSTPSVVQPFRITALTAEKLNSDVVLKWAVENNQSTTGFTVERSTDNLNFSAIGTVPVTTSTNYSFTNTNPAAGVYYYRIKRLAGSDPAIYSSVVSITISPSSPSVSTFNFLDFYLTLSGSNIAVQWVTPQEYGSKSFTIERSSDGINFTALSTLAANTNPQPSNVYGYLDVAPPAGQYSYRIKRTGTDNSIAYSALKQITIGSLASPSFKFLDFTVQQLSSGIAVQWTTGLEYDSKSFTVERSSDGGTSFSSVSVINASANPQTSNVYGYLDPTPPAGSYTYRIKRLAKDNSVSYSAIKQINISAAVNFSILQNPVTSNLPLQVNAPSSPTALQFTITDASSQVRYTEQKTSAGTFTENIAVSQLVAGVYYISVSSASGVVTKQFIKQ